MRYWEYLAERVEKNYLKTLDDNASKQKNKINVR